MGKNTGITYNYSFSFEDEEYNETGFVGEMPQLNMLMGGGSSITYYTLTLRDIGGETLPQKISIYPVDFTYKEFVTEFLDKWNSQEDINVNGEIISSDARSEIVYNDTMSIVIAMISSMIEMITTALIAFTKLSYEKSMTGGIYLKREPATKR